jgi:hypothetical protein
MQAREAKSRKVEADRQGVKSGEEATIAEMGLPGKAKL